MPIPCYAHARQSTQQQDSGGNQPVNNKRKDFI
jgi:hypothetical protein